MSSLMLTLLMEERADGGIRLRLEGDPPVESTLSADAAAALWAAPVGLPRRAPAVLNAPCALKQWVDEEEQVGLAMGRALSEAPGIVPLLLSAIRRAEERELRPVVLLELRSARLRALPWELICLGEPALRLSLQTDLLRLSRVEATPPARGPRLRHVLIVPEPDNRAMIEVKNGIYAAAQAAEVPIHTLLQGATLPLGEPGLTVLHIAAHGRREAGELYVQIEDGRLIPVLSFTESIATVARRCALVVLWSCHGAGWDDEALDTLAGRLVALGAPVVVAPAVQLPVSWARPWVSAFQASLLGQGTLLQALSQARRELARHQLAQWGYRSHHLRILAGSASGHIDAHLYWSPPGWPAVAPDLADLITRARELACARSSGFVGVEHLLWAILERATSAGPLSRLLLEQLGPAARLSLDIVSPQSAGPVDRDPPPTPRLLAWGSALPDGADAEQLWALAAADAAPLVSRDGADLNATARTLHALTLTLGQRLPPPPPETLAPPLRLEVLGGPEDGRILTPRPGQTIGRHDPTGHRVPDLALYESTRVEDTSLSRKHLLWLGPGRVCALRRGRALVRQGVSLPLPRGEHSLVVGDLLQLGEGTLLRALK